MTKARSALSIRALEILEDLSKRQHPFLLEERCEDARALGERVRQLMPKDLREKVTITNKPGILYIGTKRSTRDGLMRKLLMLVEDDELYNEAMTVLHGGDIYVQ